MRPRAGYRVACALMSVMRTPLALALRSAAGVGPSAGLRGGLPG